MWSSSSGREKRRSTDPERERARERDRESRRNKDEERDSEGRRDRETDKDTDRNGDRRRERERTSKDRDARRKRKTSRPKSTRKTSGGSSIKERHRSSDSGSDPGKDDVERTDTPGSRSSRNTKSRMSSIVPEMERRPSLAYSSYPSLSKEHAREAVNSRESIVNIRDAPFTPDPTNTDVGRKDPTSKRNSMPPRTTSGAPPSPPLTVAGDPGLKRARSGASVRKAPDRLNLSSSRPGSVDGLRTQATASRSASTSTLRNAYKERKSPSSERLKAFEEIRPRPHHVVGEGRSRSSSDLKPKKSSTPKPEVSVLSESRSDASTVPAAKHNRAQTAPSASLNKSHSPLSAHDSSPKTPTPSDHVFPHTSKQAPVVVPVYEHNPVYPQHYSGPPVAFPVPPPVGFPIPPPVGFPAPPPGGYPGPAPVAYAATPVSYSGTPISLSGTPFSINSDSTIPGPPPPPPPPPPPASMDIPRVDYLLQNGGLNRLVPRNILAAINQPAAPTPGFQSMNSPQFFRQDPPNNAVMGMFSPFINLLDEYAKVIDKNGSLAVATGYKSVARRLLDRLETVFNRNISSETCDCVICRTMVQPDDQDDEDTGVSWGEILEYVAGRRELPQWPPFTISPELLNGESKLDAPMQKLDIDVPEEYREHYIKQGKKTKDTVQKWLAAQPDEPSSPPQEVDDETLVFAMVTHLEPEKRRLFTALIRGMSNIPQSRAPTPLNVPKVELMTRTAQALQRLYRLSHPPRDPECAMYLLKYPDVHGVLATLAAISQGEWDILISGRFDGFLWSGADGNEAGYAPSRGPTPASFMPPSRGTTPYSPGRPPTAPPPSMTPATPGSSSAANRFGAPVAVDEETEIAVLAEMERDIYNGMEALEDAFEVLHRRAEAVRSLLQARGAGLSRAAIMRRGAGADAPMATLGTPAPNSAGLDGWSPGIYSLSEGLMAAARAEDDWHPPASELAPDDSASNISYKRRRKKHRAKEAGEKRELRTPAPVEEVDEDEEEVIVVEDGGRRR